ncbi:MAG: hypothetical protein WAU88_08895 [Candidatus Zixiibacteriota bacterium]
MITHNPASEVTHVNPELSSNFEDQIKRAFAYPLHLSLGKKRGISPEEIEERKRYYSGQGTPGEIVSANTSTLYEVSTEDPARLALLIAQALRRLEITKAFLILA